MSAIEGIADAQSREFASDRPASIYPHSFDPTVLNTPVPYTPRQEPLNTTQYAVNPHVRNNNHFLTHTSQPSRSHDLLRLPSTDNDVSDSAVEALFPPVEDGDANADGDGYGGYGASSSGGAHWGFWGWLSYLRTPQRDRSSFWAYEFELGVTHTFAQHLAATIEMDFMDLPGREVYMEQMFLSVLLPDINDTILTVGKFNSPFGVEPRDFWNRVSASRSLLFRKLPQDLIGLMFTCPVGDTNLTLRPMVVSGFVNTGFDNNEQPSFATMAEFRPSDDFSLGATVWYGPELDQDVGRKLFFVDAQARWFLTENFSVAGEYFSGNTELDSDRPDWRGVLALANWDLHKSLRIFAQFSRFDDRDAFFGRTAESQKEVNAGFGWYLHPLVEIRGEYRHDYRPVSGDGDNWDLHLTFGY